MTAAEVTEKLGLHNLRHRHLEKKQFLQGLYWVDFPGPKIISKLFLVVKNLIHNFPAGLKTALVVVHFLQNQKMLNQKKCVFTVAK